MNARQDWEKGTLVIKPPGQKPGEVVVYNTKSGRHEFLEVETLEESESSRGSSSYESEDTSRDSNECDNSLEVCGITLKQPSKNDGERSQKEMKDEDLEKMLAKALSATEKEEFKVMLRNHPPLFIYDYCEILGVTMIEHHINLKPNQKPVAQKLQRLGRI